MRKQKRKKGEEKLLQGRSQTKLALDITSEGIYFLSEEFKRSLNNNPDLHLHYNKKKQKKKSLNIFQVI